MYGTIVKVFPNDEGDYVCEMWGGSTKHPDLVYHLLDNEEGRTHFEIAPWVDTTEDCEVRSQIFQWLCWIASQQMIPMHAEAVIDYAMKNWLVWRTE